MTKCEIVWGMVRIVGGGTESEALALKTRFAGMEMVFLWVEVRFNMESAAWWMNVWPSSLKGRTKCRTCRVLVVDDRVTSLRHGLNRMPSVFEAVSLSAVRNCRK